MPIMKYNLLFLLCLFSLPLFAQLTVNEDTVQEKYMKNPVHLDEVVVKARSRNIDSRGLGNMRINMKQLELTPLFFGERDVIKTLQFLPGMSSGMEGSSQLNVRGGTNDQTLYLMDEVPVYNQNHTFGLFSIFNSDAIQSVDLYKGGIPAPYGDKLSGVVSVDLKEGDYQKYHHSVSLGILAGSLASEGPIVKDKLSYMITARRSFVDLLYNGFMSISSDGNGGNPMISFADVNGKMTWKVNARNTLSWQSYYGYDDLYGINRSNDRYTKEKYKEKYGYGWKTIMTSFRLHTQPRSNMTLSTTAYFTALDNFNYYKNSVKAPGVKQKTENGTSSKLNEAGVKISMRHQTSLNNTLFYGADGAYQFYSPEYIYRKTDNRKVDYNSQQQKLLKGSAYVYDEFRVAPWLFSVGLRASVYDNRKVSKFVVEPRIKVNTFLNEKNKLMLAYDRMYQPVHTVNEMDYNSKTDYWIPFQENVLPQSNQISIGWKNYTTSHLSFSVEAYYKKMRHLLLIRDLEYYLDDHTDYEQGSGSSMGVEAMVQYSKNRFTTWASYTLSRSRRTFGGKNYPFKFDAPHSLSAFASYAVREEQNNRHTLSLQAQFKKGYPYYVPEITYPGMGLPTSPDGYEDIDDIYGVDFIPQYPNIRLKNYLRIDLNYSVERKREHGNLTWQFSLLNLTNQRNPYAVYKKDGKYKAFVLIPMMPSISVRRTF